jgi:replication factor C small subunit
MNKDDIKNSLWVEKYRPNDLEQMAMQDSYRDDFDMAIRNKIIPNILLEGPPGSGKTTIARILVERLDCERLMLNASDERGIDTIRSKIKNFVKIASLKSIRIVFLDEMDNLTTDAQAALKSMMEIYWESARFIFTCNEPNKVIEPLVSRCQVYHFNAFPKEQMKNILVHILGVEKMQYEEADLDKHIKKCYPDLRKAINDMQQNIRSGKFTFIDDSDLFSKITALIVAMKFLDLRQLLAQNTLDYIGYYRHVYDNIDLFPQKARLTILLHAAEYMYRHATVPDAEINFMGGFVISTFRALKEK